MILSFFKKHSYLFYLIEAVFLGLAVLFTMLIPKEYIYWNVRNVIGYTVGLFFAYFINGVLLAGSKERSIVRVFTEGFLMGAIGAGAPYLFHAFFNLFLKLNLYTVMRMMEVFLFLLLTIAHILIVIRSAEKFDLKKILRETITVLTACVMLAICVLPFAGDFFTTYFRSYSFLSEPSVFVGPNNTYAVMFATSGPGTASIRIEKGDMVWQYEEMTNGMLSYDSQVHKIVVPKEVLDDADYTVFSRQTMDCTGTEYRMGKTIGGEKEYHFVSYHGDGDLSFMCVSDNQGTALPTQRAIEKAAKKYNYDFVMLLGDQSEAYNETEEDFISSLLTVSGLASHGELPVYYTVGNHEYRGMMSETLWELMPTPSKTHDFYYTFTMGNAYFTVLNFSNEDEDDNPRYSGLARYNEYRDREYEWLQEQMSTGAYKNYEYNIMLSHIPLINQNGEVAPEYKCKDFIELLQACDVDYIVSGHSHVKPQEFRSEGYSFANLHAGSYYDGKKQFRNSIVHLTNGKCTFEVYDSSDK